MLRSVCSLTIIAVLAASALANIGPPPPAKGFKRVGVEYLLKLDKEIPGYQFYKLKSSNTGAAIVEEQLKLEPEKGLSLSASSLPSFWSGVVAVPSKVMDELQTTENLAKLLTRENEDKRPAGIVMYVTGGFNKELKVNDPRSKVETVTTITADDKLGVKFTAVETPAPANKEAGDESSMRPHSGTMFAGMAMSVAFLTSGLWWFRRKSG